MGLQGQELAPNFVKTLKGTNFLVKYLTVKFHCKV